MLKLLVATICLTALAQGAVGKEEVPEYLVNLGNFFERMKMQQDSGRILDILQWKDSLEIIVPGWSGLSEEAVTQFEVKIEDVFTQMQNEVDAGNTLDLINWQDVLGVHLLNIVDSMPAEPTEPEYPVDPEEPKGGNNRKPGNSRGRPNKGAQGKGNGRGNGKGNGKGNGNGNGNRKNGRKQEYELPDNLPIKMKRSLKEVFDGLKLAIESCQQCTEMDLTVWKNETLNVIDGWWKPMTNMAKRKNPNTENKPFFEDVPEKWEEQINDIFTRMQAQFDSGEPLNVDEWATETVRAGQTFWNQFSRHAEPGKKTPFLGRKNLPEEIPDRWIQPLHDVFDRMQTEVDMGNPLELMQYHDEVQEIAETWWHREVSARKHEKGQSSWRANKINRDLPIEMREQITEVFSRMREETEANQWDIDYWRNETVAISQAWWEWFTDADLEMIPQNWTASVQAIFEQIEEQIDNGNSLDIAQWRKKVVNASRAWLDLEDQTLRRLGYGSQMEEKILMRLEETIPQHFDYLFDRMELAAADGPLNITEWQIEIEELVKGFGKRFLARKDRRGKPQGRPERQNGRPQKPKGRQEKPNGRRGRPQNQGRQQKPNGRQQKPNGRPEKPNGRPEKQNGRPGRPQGRQGKRNNQNGRQGKQKNQVGRRGKSKNQGGRHHQGRPKNQGGRNRKN